MARGPQVPGLWAAYGRLGEAKRAEREERQRRKESKYALVGTLAAAGLAYAIPGSTLATAALAGSAGGQIARAAAGGEVNSAALAQTGLGIAAQVEQQEQTATERRGLEQIKGSLRGPGTPGELNPEGYSVMSDPSSPEFKRGQDMYKLAGLSTESPRPLQTYASLMTARDAFAPMRTETVDFEGSKLLVQRSPRGEIDVKAQVGPSKAAEGGGPKDSGDLYRIMDAAGKSVAIVRGETAAQDAVNRLGEGYTPVKVGTNYTPPPKPEDESSAIYQRYATQMPGATHADIAEAASQDDGFDVGKVKLEYKTSAEKTRAAIRSEDFDPVLQYARTTAANPKLPLEDRYAMLSSTALNASWMGLASEKQNEEIGKLVAGLDEQIVKSRGGGGEAKEFQLFSPGVAEKEALKLLAEKVGRESDPQFYDSIQSGTAAIDDSTLRRIKATPEQFAEAQLKYIRDEVGFGKKWTDESKAAARAFINKDGGLVAQEKERTNDAISAIPAGLAASGGNVDALRKKINETPLIDKKRVLGELDRTVKNVRDAAEKADKQELDAAVKELPKHLQQKIKDAPPNQREQVKLELATKRFKAQEEVSKRMSDKVLALGPPRVRELAVQPILAYMQKQGVFSSEEINQVRLVAIDEESPTQERVAAIFSGAKSG